jgi:predicted SprT family Zn-dependent metalloprotease
MESLNVVESEVKEGICSKCGRHKYVVKVVHVKTGETEWRCNRCVRKLRRDIAHKLTQKELGEQEKFYGKRV